MKLSTRTVTLAVSTGSSETRSLIIRSFPTLSLPSCTLKIYARYTTCATFHTVSEGAFSEVRQDHAQTRLAWYALVVA